jgi:ketosteroid isomerase-like protein
MLILFVINLYFRDMKTDNKAILTHANTFIAAGNYEKFLSFCTDDTRWEFVGDQTLQGKEAVRQYMKQAYLEPPEFTVEQLIGEGEFVTAIGKITLKDQAGSLREYSYCDVWRFLDGKLAELRAFVVGA